MVSDLDRPLENRSFFGFPVEGQKAQKKPRRATKNVERLVVANVTRFEEMCDPVGLMDQGFFSQKGGPTDKGLEIAPQSAKTQRWIRRFSIDGFPLCS